MQSKSRNAIPKKFFIPMILLSILAGILTISFVLSYRENGRNYTYSVESFYYSIDSQEYTRVYECYLSNISCDVHSQKYDEVYAIAQYWHDSFYYYALKDIRDVSKYEQGRKEHAAKAGDFQYVTDNIDQIFAQYE